jgi:alpha-L-fucosidase 2
LTYYERAFILRNGFHVNGDQIGTGLSRFRYRPFTLEGNFLAMEAVHDMVLQSWPVNLAEDPTPVIRIFPAMPWRWHQASFRDLRAEGGFVVSAQWENNATTRFEVRATVDGQLRLRDNFDGREPTFNRETTRDARDFVLNLKAGETLVGTLARPSQLSPEPTDSIDVSKRLERIEQLRAAKMQK